MHTGLRAAVGIGLIVAVSGLVAAPPAWSDHRGGRRDEHREERRERARERWEDRRERESERRERAWERRREAERHAWERHRAAAVWRFERARGWRFEHRPGLWSPFHVWWWVDGRSLLRPLPTVRIVMYPTGRYELHGDGLTVPYYWVWRPAVVIAAPPPVPLPPPPVSEPLPPDYAYPPPPPPPAS